MLVPAEEVILKSLALLKPVPAAEVIALKVVLSRIILSPWECLKSAIASTPTAVRAKAASVL
ncbi:MAG: hypothetical protein V7L21_32630 [Nostoc sp.]|uniref:hypothetical protein n=1 Tax=Nostoc sp. TaxID=1180 RepID=UPI002FFB78E0